MHARSLRRRVAVLAVAAGLGAMTPIGALAVPLRDLPDAAVGDPEAAETETLFPDVVEERLRRALDLLNGGELGRAIEMTREVLESNPNSAAGYEILGAALALKGKSDKGLEALRKAVTLNPEQSSAHTKIGDILLAQGEVDAAKEKFQTAVELAPDDRRAHQRLGIIFEKRGRYAKAVEHYEKGLVGAPADYIGIKVNLARLYNRAGRFDKAASLLKPVLSEDQGSPTAHIVLGTSFLAQAQIDQALAEFKLARRGAPERTGPRLAEGIAYRLAGRYADSVDALERVLEQRPDWWTAHFQLAETHRAKGDTEAAVARYRKAASLSPDSDLVRRRIGALYLSQDNPSEAAEVFASLVESGTATVDDYIQLARARERAGQVDGAAGALDALIAQYPQASAAYRRAARYQAARRRYDAAVALLEQGVEALPQDPGLRQLLSLVHSRAGNHAAAIAQAEGLLKLRPDDPDVLFLLASLYEDANQHQEASAYYRRVLEHDPDHVPALNNLAMALSGRDKHAEAVELARRAHALAGDTPTVKDTLGWVIYRAGRPQEAAELLEAAAAAAGTDPTILFHLAVVRHALGEDAAARRHLERALTSSSGFKQADEARALQRQLEKQAR